MAVRHFVDINNFYCALFIKKMDMINENKPWIISKNRTEIADFQVLIFKGKSNSGRCSYKQTT